MVKHTFTWLKVLLIALPLVAICLAYTVFDDGLNIIGDFLVLMVVAFGTAVLGLIIGWVLNLFTNFRGAAVLYSVGHFLAVIISIGYFLSEQNAANRQAERDTYKESARVKALYETVQSDDSSSASAWVMQRQKSVLEKLESLLGDTVYSYSICTSEIIDSAIASHRAHRFTIAYTMPPDDQNWISSFTDTDTGLRIERHRVAIGAAQLHTMMTDEVSPLLKTLPGY